MSSLQPYRTQISSVLLICFGLIAFDQLVFSALHEFSYAYTEMAQGLNHDQLHLEGIDHSHGGIDLLQDAQDKPTENTTDLEVDKQTKVLPSSLDCTYIFINDVLAAVDHFDLVHAVFTEINGPPPRNV